MLNRAKADLAASVGDNAGGDRPREMEGRRDGSDSKQLVQPAVEGSGPIEFVRRGALVRVDHGRVWHVGDPVSGQQDFPSPLHVLADRRLAKWMLLPDRSPNTRADVVKRAAVE